MASLLDDSRRNSARPEPSVQERRPELTYEEQLNSDPRWALSEGSRYFEEKSAVQEALRKITGRLDALGIRYAVAGAMALFAHGFRRFTEVVDILVTREDLKTIHRKLEGLGYIKAFAGSKHLRDVELKVNIEFLLAGDYPGDCGPSKRYVTRWRHEPLPAPAKTLDDLIQALAGEAGALEAMRADGVIPEPEGGAKDGKAHLVTTDPEVAKKYGMHPEDEFFDEDEEPGGG
jgi:hypothetical protein